jgi:hypothetical protein
MTVLLYQHIYFLGVAGYSNEMEKLLIERVDWSRYQSVSKR